jgi:circadian clock protein KaiC
MVAATKRKPKLFFGGEEEEVRKREKSSPIEEDAQKLEKDKNKEIEQKAVKQKVEKKLEKQIKVKEKKKEKIIEKIIKKDKDQKKVKPQKKQENITSMVDIKKAVQKSINKIGLENKEIISTEVKKKPGEIDMSSIKQQIESEIHANNKKEETEEEHEKKHTSKERMHTGIPGLDDVMEGGFKKSSMNLVGGGAGCGKSIFCMQFLIDGIENHDEPGIYISFEEDEEKIKEDFERFNWNIDKKIKENKLTILFFSPEQVEHVIEKGGGVVRDAIESTGAKRLVIDSLTAFTLLHDGELAKRKVVLKLFEAIKKWGITALMTSEQEPDPEHHHSTLMEFEVDGVILLYNVRKGDVRERSLEIFKMRGTVHSAKIFPMAIGEEGIIIYPEQTVF